jgi:GTPase SAR1 family protein
LSVYSYQDDCTKISAQKYDLDSIGRLKMTEFQILESAEVQQLAILIEEATRSSSSGAKYFVEPAQGVLDRAMAKRHHIIFGRRGSGKSSLLNKLQNEASVNRYPVAFVDMEEFKTHSFPDVLISVLIKILNSFDEWLKSAAVEPATKKSFWDRIFGMSPKRGSLNRANAEQLGIRVRTLAETLNSLLFAPENSNNTETADKRSENSEVAGLIASAEIQTPLVKGAINTDSKTSIAKSTGTSITTQYASTKTEVLQRKIIELKNLLVDIRTFSGEHGYVLIDDLYHIRTSSQADVIDYLHRICKGTGIWLKIGTIRHRTRYYLGGDPPRGMKIGDDADDIDLDVTLEKYQITKRFLLKVLEQFCTEKNIKLNEIVTDGAKDRLVLASGGVARDFLTSFRRSITIAKERLANGDSVRGRKIGAEDVNVAAGENDSNKREEFNTDAPTQEQQKLLDLFGRVINFCINTNNSNCFLIEKDYRGSEVADIGELVDLKFVHHISSRETVRNRTGKVYDAYMLDLSQYTGERTKRNFNMIEFWDQGNKDALRKSPLIFLEN